MGCPMHRGYTGDLSRAFPRRIRETSTTSQTPQATVLDTACQAVVSTNAREQHYIYVRTSRGSRGRFLRLNLLCASNAVSPLR
jgi:hypothetical protein